MVISSRAELCCFCAENPLNPAVQFPRAASVIRTSEVFHTLRPEQAGILEEILYDSFWGGNVLALEDVHIRFNRMIEAMHPDDEQGLCRVILDGLGV
jgi:hypothetical protein